MLGIKSGCQAISAESKQYLKFGISHLAQRFAKKKLSWENPGKIFITFKIKSVDNFSAF